MVRNGIYRTLVGHTMWIVRKSYFILLKNSSLIRSSFFD